MKVKKNNAIHLIILNVYILLFFLLIVFLYERSGSEVSFKENLIFFSAVVGILFVVHTYVGKIIFGKLLSFEYIFIVFCYIFYFGQVVLYAAGSIVVESVLYTAETTYGCHNYFCAIRYAIVCVSVTFLGMCLARVLKQKIYIDTNIENRGDLNNFFGNALICINSPFVVADTLIKLIAMSRGHYAEAHDAGLGILGYFCSAALFAAFILKMLINKDVKKQPLKYLIILIVYNTVYMFTGMRALAAIRIMIGVILYYVVVNKFNFKSLIKLLSVAFLFSFVLIVIGDNRKTGISLSSFDPSIISGMVNRSLCEYGFTISVTARAFSRVTEFKHGMSLFSGFLSIVPGWANLFGTDLDLKYNTFFALDQQHTGSSYISDLYFDFGEVGGIIGSLIYGYLYALFCINFSRDMKVGNYRKAVVWVYFISEMIFTVRSYIFRLPRYFIYFLVIYIGTFVLSKLLFPRNALRGSFFRDKQSSISLNQYNTL